jgi:uncharacterized membrane protein (TIGR02234 family)
VTRIGQLLLVTAALALWGASRLTWVTLESADGLGQPRTTTLSGATWSAAMVPVALLLAAAALAPLAVRGWALRAVAVLLAVVSAGLGYLAISLWVVPDVAAYAASAVDLPVHALVGSDRQYVGAILTLLAAVMTLAAAVLLLRSAKHPRATSTKYAAPAARREEAAREPAAESGDEKLNERLIWDALDEGRDPTTDHTEGR